MGDEKDLQYLHGCVSSNFSRGLIQITVIYRYNVKASTVPTVQYIPVCAFVGCT